jgi:hypothetical protein
VRHRATQAGGTTIETNEAPKPIFLLSRSSQFLGSSYQGDLQTIGTPFWHWQPNTPSADADTGQAQTVIW